ncbi:relaxase domain-containing protein [Nocardia uniformis]|uniref:Relaxase domain-containing protein n=3 Tax=Nocardia uniformis TaxID=53432 RepID=A0A849BXJ0_9NOCA|nr:MobF family relaxase [Nocardia uniformis]NNH70994.1 relaxase domain-containing protein [Nocardia uniformis]
MTLHRLHAGDGYEYLTRQVASGDRLRDRTRDLTDYYVEHGTPPGVWMGKGAAALGLSGMVTEAQMQALFGEGLHPDADAIIAAAIADGKTAKQAVEAAQIGRMFYEFATEPSVIRDIHDRKIDEFTFAQRRRPDWDERTILRTDAAREHLTGVLGRVPNRAEIDQALADEKAATRKAVAGFDCVFTPQKSISILWGLGSDAVRREIWQCHLEAVQEVLEFAESRYAVTRRGANGVMQIDATGLIIAAFTHFDNRAGDMNPHTHAVISNKVLGSDGKWSALDARALYAAAVSMSCRYNATIVGKLKRRMGLRFEERTRGRGKQPVLEVVGISEEMIAEFSRRDVIVARFEHLVADYHAAHGRTPNKVTQYRLAQQATLETRAGKPLPKPLRQMVDEWDGRFRCLFGRGRGGQQFVDDMVWAHNHPNAPRPFDPADAIVEIGVGLGGGAQLLTATPLHQQQAIAAQLNRYQFGTTEAAADAARTLSMRLASGPDETLLDRIDATVLAHRRAIYDPAAIAVEVTATVARRRATWTEANIRSATEERVGVCDFVSDEAQRAAVEAVTAAVRDRHSILLTIDPDPVPAVMARASGESVFTTTGTARWTSHAVLDAEIRLLNAARTPTAAILTAREVDSAIERIQLSSVRALNPGQREIARYLCTAPTKLAVVIGPAGSGKTTAMQAVATAWRDAGRDVIALAPSASAARELSASLGVPARTIHKLLAQARHGVPTGITPGAMLLLDEAAMAATFDLDALLTLADTHGAVIRGVGDPAQLSAVESGGIIATIARDNRAPALTELVRFTDPAEAEATLAVRAGNAKHAWEFYDSHGRVTHGLSDQLRTAILSAHLADTDAGISSVMIAATLADVSALNTAAQAIHLGTGRVRHDGGGILLSDNHTGHLGDAIVTRLNNPGLKILGGHRHGTQVDNGDLWHIHRIHRDGSVTVTGIGHRGHVTLPPGYVAHEVELGYAASIHRSQGITVRHAYTLLDDTLGRALAYVGLTRGTDLNQLFLATDALIDFSGDQQPDDPREPFRCFARVLAREDDNRSATDIMRDEQAAADHRVRVNYQHAYQLLADARGEFLLTRALPVLFAHEAKHSPKYQDLLDTIALADAHRLDTGELVAAIATNNCEDLGESLATARDTAAVLRARADRWIQQRLAPIPNLITVAPVETLTTTDPHAITDTIDRLNTLPVMTTPAAQRFRALRDAPYSGPFLPVPTPWSGMDTELVIYARELRRRLLSPTADTTLPDTTTRQNVPPVAAHHRPDSDESQHLHHPTIVLGQAETLTATGSYDSSAFITRINTLELLITRPELVQEADARRRPAPVTAERLARMHADYHAYVKQLADTHTERTFYRAMPAVLYRLAANSRHWNALLDTMALAAAHRLDTTALIAAIATDNGNDLGASLLLVPDTARELRDRADIWIFDHLPDPRPTPKTRRFRIADTAPDGRRQTRTWILDRHPNPQPASQNRQFRALTDLPYTGQFRPIPNYPGRDENLANFARELRTRIKEAQSRHRSATSASAPSPTTTPAPRSPASRKTAASARRRIKPASAARRPRRRGM